MREEIAALEEVVRGPLQQAALDLKDRFVDLDIEVVPSITTSTSDYTARQSRTHDALIILRVCWPALSYCTLTLSIEVVQGRANAFIAWQNGVQFLTYTFVEVATSAEWPALDSAFICRMESELPKIISLFQGLTVNGPDYEWLEEPHP